MIFLSSKNFHKILLYFHCRIKSSLNHYFESTGRVAVYFERNVLSAHFQLHVVPISKKKKDYLESIFKVILVLCIIYYNSCIIRVMLTEHHKLKFFTG